MACIDYCSRPKICYILKYFSLCVIFILSLQVLFYMNFPDEDFTFTDFKEAGFVLLWWTPFIRGERIQMCENVRCLVSHDRSLKNSSNVAFLFYGTHFNVSDVPLPRGSSVWALLHEESPRNSPLLAHEPILNLFNFSSTFSRHSDVPLTLQYLNSLDALTDKKYFKTFEEKSQTNLAPIVYIQSDCQTPNNRDSYVAELMKYIDVDSYGKCLNNRQLPNSLKEPLDTMMSEELLDLVSKYKFSVSFENAICDDYITEKLWRPLMAGSVPLYIGSPSVKEFLPNDKAAIFPLDFESPKDLADYLAHLLRNEADYNKHLKHKLETKIDNELLLSTFRSMIDGSFIDDFECFICKSLHKNVKNIVDKSHYNCPKPVSIVSKTHNASNWWHYDFLKSKCDAEFLRNKIDNNKTVNVSDLFYLFYNNENDSCSIQL